MPSGSALQRLWREFRKHFSPGAAPAESEGWPARTAWKPAGGFGRAQAISVVLHVALAAALTVPVAQHVKQQEDVLPGPPVYFPGRQPAPPAAKGKKAGGGGEGGGREAEPPTRGRVPPFAAIQFVPPIPKIRNLKPIITADSTLLGPPELRVSETALSNLGDPKEFLVNLSAGPGGRAGIGRGKNGRGMGEEGKGDGYGPGEDWGTGGSRRAPGNRIGATPPQCQYCPDPKYTDEARKAKYQGRVTLAAVVTPEGRATNIRVLQGVGLGLDERAVETVSGWRFRPAIGPDGQPVAYEVMVEVVFRLL